MSKFKPHIALLVCNILWAMDYPFYNIVLPEYVHPMAMVSGSLIATALLSLIPLAWEKSEKVARTDIRRLIGAALLIGVLRKAFIMYGLLDDVAHRTGSDQSTRSFRCSCWSSRCCWEWIASRNSKSPVSHSAWREPSPSY